VNLERNLWENDTFAVFDTFLDRAHSYIDIGAWVGPTTLYACQLARHCYAVEPDPVAFKMLRDNLALNPGLKDKLSLTNACIGSASGTVKLGSKTQFGDSRSSIEFGDSAGSLTVESLALDDFASKNNITDCNFIKMDIEGGEAEVLPAMKSYLEKNKPVLLLSLHPFWFKDRARGTEAIIEALRVYKHIFYTNGIKLNLEKLSRLLSSEEKSLSIIAADKWGLYSRLPFILRIF
jgi:FkbM family methyltransferase